AGGAMGALARDSCASERIFPIPSSITAHPADCRQDWEEGVLDVDRRTRGPDEIAHLLQKHGALEQLNVARPREFAVAAEPELSLEEDFSRCQGGAVLVEDPQDALTSVPLAV